MLFAGAGAASLAAVVAGPGWAIASGESSARQSPTVTRAIPGPASSDLIPLDVAPSLEQPSDLVTPPPDPPEPPLDPTPVDDLATGQPSLDTTWSPRCSAGAIEIRVENPTADAVGVKLRIDGNDAGGAVILPGAQHLFELPLAENDTADVSVLAGDDEIFAQAISMDCLVPEPGYEVVSSCGAIPAIRLSNGGADVAHMTVQYGEAPYTLQPVAPGAHLDWPVPLDSGEQAVVNVIHAHEVIGSEVMTNGCDTDSMSPTQTPPPAGPTGFEPDAAVSPMPAGESGSTANPEEVAGAEQLEASVLDEGATPSRAPASSSRLGPAIGAVALLGVGLAGCGWLWLLFNRRPRDA